MDDPDDLDREEPDHWPDQEPYADLVDWEDELASLYDFWATESGASLGVLSPASTTRPTTSEGGAATQRPGAPAPAGIWLYDTIGYYAMVFLRGYAPGAGEVLEKAVEARGLVCPLRRKPARPAGDGEFYDELLRVTDQLGGKPDTRLVQEIVRDSIGGAPARSRESMLAELRERALELRDVRRRFEAERSRSALLGEQVASATRQASEMRERVLEANTEVERAEQRASLAERRLESLRKLFESRIRSLTERANAGVATKEGDELRAAQATIVELAAQLEEAQEEAKFQREGWESAAKELHEVKRRSEALDATLKQLEGVKQAMEMELQQLRVDQLSWKRSERERTAKARADTRLRPGRTSRVEEFLALVAAWAPRIRILRPSAAYLEQAVHTPIHNVLARLDRKEPDVRLKDVKGADGWRELDQHLATGVDDAGRLYLGHHEGRLDVLLAFKDEQERSVRWLAKRKPGDQD